MYSEKPKLHQRQKEHKHGELRTIVLDVTPKCNMRCSHCYAETFVNAKPLDLKIVGKALDEAYQLGVYHFIFEGGEPILDPDRLEPILKMCHPDETYINVVTNGWNMTLENIRKLKELKVDKISFSLDSGIEKEHDQNRLKGSFKRTHEAIDNVLKEGLLASISIVVTHKSLYLDGFFTALDYAISKGIRFDTQIAEPVGKWDGKIDLLMTNRDSAFLKWVQGNCGVLDNGQRIVSRDLFTGEFDHCPAGTEVLGISVDGQVLPCNFLQYTLGNIKDKSLKEMRDILLTNKWFDGYHRMCLCGENMEFINKYIVPYINEPKPLDAYKIFGLR